MINFLTNSRVNVFQMVELDNMRNYGLNNNNQFYGKTVRVLAVIILGLSIIGFAAGDRVIEDEVDSDIPIGNQVGMHSFPSMDYIAAQGTYQLYIIDPPEDGVPNMEDAVCDFDSVNDPGDPDIGSADWDDVITTSQNGRDILIWDSGDNMFRITAENCRETHIEESATNLIHYDDDNEYVITDDFSDASFIVYDFEDGSEAYTKSVPESILEVTITKNDVIIGFDDGGDIFRYDYDRSDGSISFVDSKSMPDSYDWIAGSETTEYAFLVNEDDNRYSSVDPDTLEIIDSSSDGDQFGRAVEEINFDDLGNMYFAEDGDDGDLLGMNVGPDGLLTPVSSVSSRITAPAPRHDYRIYGFNDDSESRWSVFTPQIDMPEEQNVTFTEFQGEAIQDPAEKQFAWFPREGAGDWNVDTMNTTVEVEPDDSEDASGTLTLDAENQEVASMDYEGDGTIQSLFGEFTPSPAELGEYQFTATAVDGFQTVSEDLDFRAAAMPDILVRTEGLQEDVSDGDSVNIEVDIWSGTKDVLENDAEVRVYEEGDLIFEESDIPGENLEASETTDEDYKIIFDDVFTAEVFKEYTLEGDVKNEDGISYSFSDSFEVDNSPPDLEIRNFNKDLETNDVSFEAFTSDSELGIDKVEYEVYTGDGNLVNLTEMDYEREEDGFEVYTHAPFTIEDDEDYTLEVTSSDKDGLETTEAKEFIIESPKLDKVVSDPLVSDANFSDQLDIKFNGTLGTRPELEEVNVEVLEDGVEVKSQTFLSSDIDYDAGVFSLYLEEFVEADFSHESEIDIVVDLQDQDGRSDEQTYSDIFTVVLQEIEDFVVEPELGNAVSGEFWDYEVSGTVGELSVVEIVYSLQVSGETDPSDVSVEPDFADQNSFIDSESDVFERLEEYGGNEVTAGVEVIDADGNSVTESITEVLGTPPNDFLQVVPDDNEVFLIPDGEQDTEVTIEYGVDSINAGLVELVVNEEIEDSFSIGEDEVNTEEVTTPREEDTYEWYVKFTDDSDGEVYTSSTRSFDVTDEPINLRLLSPSEESLNIMDGSTLDVDHNFEVDARALGDEYYYEFELVDATDSTTLESVTSANLDTGIEEFTETVEVSEGSYEWTVLVYHEDDTQLESDTTTYDVVEDPLFESDITRPRDNEVFDYVGEPINVNSSYRVEAYNQDVITEYYFEGDLIDSRTIEAGTTEEPEFTLEDLEEGSYELELVAEDEDGREETETVGFSVEEDMPEITTVQFEPSIEEASVGDEIDLYIEGSGVPDDVDFIELELFSDGEEFETILIPTEDLEEGSWFTTIPAAFEVTNALLGTELSVSGVLTDVSGRISSYLQSFGIFGEKASVSGALISPEDDRTLEQVSGEPTSVQHRFRVTAQAEPVDYELYVRGEEEHLVENGTVEDLETSTELDTFVNHVDDLNEDQLQTFDWWLNLEEQSTGDTFSTPIWSYNIVEDTEEPVLNFNEPRNNQIFYFDTGYEEATVEFGFDVDTDEEGTLSLEIEDNIIYEEEVGEGFTQDSLTDQFEEGSYEANLTITTENYEVSKIREFAIDEEDPEDTEPTVRLREPSDDRNLYRNVGNTFSWSVFGTDEGDTTLYIEDSTGSVVEQFDRSYDTREEQKAFREVYTTDLPTGDYEFYAEFEQDGTVYESDTRSFTVVDFNEPRTELVNPINDTFSTEDFVDFQFITESFEEALEVELRVREVGTHSTDVIFSSAQDSNEERTYEQEEGFDSGRYEWFVRMDANGAVFDSDTATFTVEEVDIDEPLFDLIEPEQDEEYEIPEGEETTDIDFRYLVELFSQDEAEVELFLQNVDNGTDYESIFSSNQDIEDGEVEYEHTEALEEAGYRYKIVVEYPNGVEHESNVVSFAVGDAEVPTPTPDRSILDDAWETALGFTTGLAALINATAQFFLATAVIVIFTGIVQKVFDFEYLSLITAILLALGFSFADGWYPLGVFWILVAISAGIATIIGVKTLSGRTGNGGG